MCLWTKREKKTFVFVCCQIFCSMSKQIREKINQIISKEKTVFLVLMYHFPKLKQCCWHWGKTGSTGFLISVKHEFCVAICSVECLYNVFFIAELFGNGSICVFALSCWQLLLKPYAMICVAFLQPIYRWCGVDLVLNAADFGGNAWCAYLVTSDEWS